MADKKFFEGSPGSTLFEKYAQKKTGAKAEET